MRTTVYVRPVTLSIRTPASPCVRSSTAQNSAGRVSARIPAVPPAMEVPAKKQSDVLHTPQKAVIPARGCLRSIRTSLGAGWIGMGAEDKSEERRERSAWWLEGVEARVFVGRDDDGGEWRVRCGLRNRAG